MLASAVADSSLSSRARRHLRALAHSLDPVVHVGNGGVTDEVCRAVDTALEDHELIKVKVGEGFPGDRKTAATDLSQATNAHVAQIIGRIVVLYRARGRRDDSRSRIVLPR